MKTCNVCEESKPVEEFYKKDGERRSTRCRDCYNAQLNASRRNDEYRKRRNEYNKSRRTLPQVRARERRHSKVYSERYPERNKAKQVVRRALEAGQIERPAACTQCGENPGLRSDGRALIQAHHDDYAAPLDVQWLCVHCHSLEHRALPLEGE